MQALQDLRNILKTIAKDVEVLPAVGGAVEDLERPTSRSARTRR